MKQICLFDLLSVPADGTILGVDDVGSVVSFQWLCDHIGAQVALRRVTESLKYCVVLTVQSLTVGTYCSGCRRIVLSCNGKSAALLDEPCFYLGGPFRHLVFTL